MKRGGVDYRGCPNLVRLFLDQAAMFGDAPFLWAKCHGAWTSWSWAAVAADVRRLARGLAALGVKPGDRVVLAAENRPEWVIADLAIMAAGAVTVPAYTTNTVDDQRHIVSNTSARGIIASTKALADVSLAAARQVPGCEFLICIEAPHVLQFIGVHVESWADALARGNDGGDLAGQTAARLTRDDLACIIHTSGTGGLPKGVMLAHGAILSNCLGAHDLLMQLGLDDEVFLSFLPLSHSYEHTAGLHFPISIGAQIYFAESIEHLAGNLLEVQPTIMTAVPRLYETLHRRILIGVERGGALKAKLFFAALALGRKRYENGGRLGPLDSLADRLLERLVRDKVRARFGGRLKALVSGGAALSPEIGLFFTALGVRLLQGYGQTETAPVVACNPPARVKIDTVGPPVTDVEVRIAADGEILVRGELVMKGYWNEPKATAEAIVDGWMHTGDIGLIDGDGYLKITDRKRDFIKTSGGDMIAPARVEGLLVLEREIAQAMAYGDRRPYLVAILAPHPDFIAAWAATHGKPPSPGGWPDDKAFLAALDAAVERVNAKLQPAERIRRFVLAREPFSVANEMMTPTLKVKRHKVRAAYAAELDGLYDARR
jgi:long-chain acyl-CoA synthetase